MRIRKKREKYGKGVEERESVGSRAVPLFLLFLPLSLPSR
jgi:hypothetical protein